MSRHVEPGTCGGCLRLWKDCDCDAMGIPATDPKPLAAPRRCRGCNCLLAVFLGGLEEHRPGCPNFPL